MPKSNTYFAPFISFIVEYIKTPKYRYEEKYSIVELSKLIVLLKIIPNGRNIKNKTKDQIKTEKEDLSLTFFLINFISKSIIKYARKKRLI